MIIDSFLGTLFLLLAGHALADGPLQDTDLAERKRSMRPAVQFQALAVHGLVHGGLVALVTGYWWMGAAEAAAHAVVDYLKAQEVISHRVDQITHLACKVLWAALAVYLTGAPLC